MSVFSGSCKQTDVKFVTILIKLVCTYTSLKGLIFQKVKKAYVFEVASSSKDLKEYNSEGERSTRIMSLETDPNTKVIDQIVMDMLYQADITDYNKIIIEFK